MRFRFEQRGEFSHQFAAFALAGNHAGQVAMRHTQSFSDTNQINPVRSAFFVRAQFHFSAIVLHFYRTVKQIVTGESSAKVMLCRKKAD